MLRPCILLLRLALLLMTAGIGVLVLAVVPVLSIELARESGAASARFLYPAMGLVWWACLCVAVMCAWVLLGRVRPGTLFAASSSRWMSRMVTAGAVATAACLVAAVHAYVAVEPPLDAPGLVVVGLIGVAVTGAATLAGWVLRAVLGDAIALVARRPVADPPRAV